MPFFEDIGADDEVLQRPIWGAFALIKDNLERLVITNLAWSLQFVPAMLALAFTGLPTILRVLLLLYSAIVLVPATGTLFRLMARVAGYEALRFELVKEEFHEVALRSFICLSPLFGMVGLLLWFTVLASFAHIILLDILMRFTLLVLFVCASYWGPLFAEYSMRSPLFILQQSLLLVWRYPAPTLLTGAVVLLAMIIGTVSIGGLFLIVPVVVALLQTRRCYELLARESARQQRK